MKCEVPRATPLCFLVASEALEPTREGRDTNTEMVGQLFKVSWAKQVIKKKKSSKFVDNDCDRLCMCQSLPSLE